jgi:hypothetical protein
MAPDGVKRLKQSIDNIDSDNGLLQNSERLEHDDYVTFGQMTEIMTLHEATRRSGTVRSPPSAHQGEGTTPLPKRSPN